MLAACSVDVLVPGVTGIIEGFEVCVSKLSSTVDIVDGLGLRESVVSGDEELSSVDLASVSSEDAAAIVRGLTRGDEVTAFWEVDVGLKVSGVSPDPSSSSVKRETELVCSVVMDGCSVLDDSGSSVLSSISVDASVVSSLTDCDAGVDVCNS